MAGHVVTIIPDDLGYFARCTCRKRSPSLPRWQQADDWRMEHAAEVERIKAHLRRGSVSLTESRDHYLRMAAAADTAAERRQWQMLADELTHRLGDGVPEHEGQEPLF